MRYETLVAILLAVSVPAHAEVRVIDGDTIAIDRVHVRLFGIDSPERGQPGAPESTEYLRRLIGSERPDCRTVDYDKRNERPVMLCEVRGRDLSLEMVRAGWAVVWCTFVRNLRPALLRPMREAEAEARTAKRGIWVRPVQPWRDWGCGRTFIRK